MYFMSFYLVLFPTSTSKKALPLNALRTEVSDGVCVMCVWQESVHYMGDHSD